MRFDRRVTDLFGIDLPILQAPMAGIQGAELCIAVSEAGGLGALPCALLSPAQARSELERIRARTRRPINVNFFCHTAPAPDPARDAAWKQRLAPYYVELGLDPAALFAAANRAPFDEIMCALVEEFRPEVVSFHFGLPARPLLSRVRATGAKIVSSATSAEEARWLESEGCDVIIAQGFEAGGHQGHFLRTDIAGQVGLMALLPQIADAVRVPVIAAGGIADGRGIVAAFALGAAAVQIGTAYLLCPEAKTIAPHRQALRTARQEQTALTNVFTGRPARSIVNRFVAEVGPMSTQVPAFPLAAGALAPLRAAAEARGSGDFSPLWSGQAGRLAREMPAGELTRTLAAEAWAHLHALAARLSAPPG
jgi:nitronate monooxygenase